MPHPLQRHPIIRQRSPQEWFAAAADSDPVALLAEVSKQATCQGYDPELFFPTSDREIYAKPAKQICGRCPMVQQCLLLALSGGEQFAIMGGTTAQERRELRDLAFPHAPKYVRPVARVVCTVCGSEPRATVEGTPTEHIHPKFRFPCPGGTQLEVAV